MGQRHQIWLIAKVVPRDSTDNKAYYRSLGGFHNQCCYGRLPPRAVRRFIDLAKQKDNAEIIQIELDGVQKKYSRDAGEGEMPVSPCPYTQFLLGLSCCVDLDSTPETYVSGPTYDGYRVPATLRGSFDYGPDDGISVIDVTDPMNPSYCHILSHSPLNAGQYIGRYYGSLRAGATSEEQEMYMKLKKHIETVIASLDGVGVVTTEMLAEAWPGEYNPRKGSKQLDEVADPSDEIAVAEDNIVPKLADLVVGPAVKQSIAQGNFDELEKLVWIPEKAKLIKAALREIDPFPDAAIPLLRRVYEVESQTNEKELDLTGLPLSSDQILEFVSQRGDIQRLRLSNMPYVTIDTVRKLLTLVPPISHLNLLGTPIADEAIFELLSKEPKLFYHVEALVHPALLRYDATASYKAAFTFPGVLCPLMGGCPAVPFFTPQKVVQMFFDFAAGMYRKGRAIPGVGFYVGPRGSTMLATACLASDRAQGQKFGERSVPIFPLFCKGYLDGEGWALLVSETAYSFCRLLKGEAGAADMELLDLDGFLAAMEAEGRPAPLPASVSELKGLVAEIGLEIMDKKEAGYSLQMLKRDVTLYHSM